MFSFDKVTVRGFLVSVGVTPPIFVKFQFNPLQLTDKRTVNHAQINAPALLMPVRQYSQGGDRTISFTVRVDSLYKHEMDLAPETDESGSIWPELNKYRAFLYPQTKDWKMSSTPAGFAGVYKQTREFQSPPLCLFGFGPSRVMNCIVTEVSITELLFNEKLDPVRADVAITLVEIVPYDDQLR